LKTIFFNIPAHGHINPALPVVRELVARGEQVICVNTEDQRAAHEAVGAQFIAYPAYEDQGLLMDQIGGGTLVQNALMLTHISERLIPWVFELLDRECPDYLIHDSLAVWAKQAAEQRGIRAATSMSTFVVSRDALPPFTPRMILDLAALLARRAADAPDARRAPDRLARHAVGCRGISRRLYVTGLSARRR